MSEGTKLFILDALKRNLCFYDTQKDVIFQVLDKYSSMRIALIRTLLDEVIKHNDY